MGSGGWPVFNGPRLHDYREENSANLTQSLAKSKWSAHNHLRKIWSLRQGPYDRVLATGSLRQGRGKTKSSAYSQSWGNKNQVQVINLEKLNRAHTVNLGNSKSRTHGQSCQIYNQAIYNQAHTINVEKLKSKSHSQCWKSLKSNSCIKYQTISLDGSRRSEHNQTLSWDIMMRLKVTAGTFHWHQPRAISVTFAQKKSGQFAPTRGSSIPQQQAQSWEDLWAAHHNGMDL